MFASGCLEGVDGLLQIVTLRKRCPTVRRGYPWDGVHDAAGQACREVKARIEAHPLQEIVLVGLGSVATGDPSVPVPSHVKHCSARQPEAQTLEVKF